MNPFQTSTVKNPIQAMGEFVDTVRSVLQNPSSVADVMLKREKIDQDTYNAVKGMSPQQVGQYLMKNGLLNPQQAQEMYQKDVPRFQNMF